jgi:hypothetical protein
MKNAALLSGALVVPISATLETDAGAGSAAFCDFVVLIEEELEVVGHTLSSSFLPALTLHNGKRLSVLGRVSDPLSPLQIKDCQKSSFCASRRTNSQLQSLLRRPPPLARSRLRF